MIVIRGEDKHRLNHIADEARIPSSSDPSLPVFRIFIGTREKTSLGIKGDGAIVMSGMLSSHIWLVGTAGAEDAARLCVSARSGAVKDIKCEQDVSPHRRWRTHTGMEVLSIYACASSSN